MPHSVHHNNISVDNNEDIIACRPAVPRIAGRIGVFAPSSFRYNNVNLASRKTTGSFSNAPPNPYTEKKEEAGFNTHFTNNSTAQVVHDSKLTKLKGVGQDGYMVFDTGLEREQVQQTGTNGKYLEEVRQTGIICEELSENNQIKGLKDVNREEKWSQTRLRIAQAKSNFQKSMEQLNNELTLAKEL